MDHKHLPIVRYEAILDKTIGSHISKRRKELGLSRRKVSGFLGITPQQLCKYEQGINRISASTLFQLSCLLEVPINYFFPFENESAITSFLYDPKVT